MLREAGIGQRLDDGFACTREGVAIAGLEENVFRDAFLCEPEDAGEAGDAADGGGEGADVAGAQTPAGGGGGLRRAGLVRTGGRGTGHGRGWVTALHDRIIASGPTTVQFQ